MLQTHRKLLDTTPVPADRGARRAARMAPDVIERTAPLGDGSVSEAERQGRQARGASTIDSDGAARTVVTDLEWPDGFVSVSRSIQQAETGANMMHIGGPG